MPIIEAMVKGIPVACSNVSSLPEIAGSAALLFDPLNIDSITEAMHRLADDSEFRKKLIFHMYCPPSYYFFYFILYDNIEIDFLQKKLKKYVMLLNLYHSLYKNLTCTNISYVVQ